MKGGSNPKIPVSEGIGVRPGRTRIRTDDVRGIVLDEISNFRGVATINNPTGLCRLVEPFLDFRTEFVRGAGSPAWSPMEGIQADVRYIQQPGEPSTQRRLPPRGQIASQTTKFSLTT